MSDPARRPAPGLPRRPGRPRHRRRHPGSAAPPRCRWPGWARRSWSWAGAPRSWPQTSPASRATPSRSPPMAVDLREFDAVDAALDQRARAARPHRPARQQRRRPVPGPGRERLRQRLPRRHPPQPRRPLVPHHPGRRAFDDPQRLRQGRQRHHDAAARHPRHGALVGGPRRDREPDPDTRRRVGAATASDSWPWRRASSTPRRGRATGSIPRRSPGSMLLRRLQQPEEVAAIIAFCLCPAGDYITGTTIVSDGGWDLVGPFPAM